MEPIRAQPEELADATSRTSSPRSDEGPSNLSGLDSAVSACSTTHDGAPSVDAGFSKGSVVDDGIRSEDTSSSKQLAGVTGGEISADKQMRKEFEGTAGGRGRGTLSPERTLEEAVPRKGVGETKSDKHQCPGLITPDSLDECSPQSEEDGTVDHTVGGSHPEISGKQVRGDKRLSIPLTEERFEEKGGDLRAPNETSLKGSVSRGLCTPVDKATAVIVAKTKPDESRDCAGSDTGAGCQRHGFVTCVLCNNGGLVGPPRTVLSDEQSVGKMCPTQSALLPVQAAGGGNTAAFHLTALARSGSSRGRGGSSSGRGGSSGCNSVGYTSGGNSSRNSREKNTAVLPEYVATLRPISTTLAAEPNDGGLHIRDAERQHDTKPNFVTPGALRESTRTTPCERHLLRDCILCQMVPTARGSMSPLQFGRSASLPTLGVAPDIEGANHGGAHDVQAMPVTAAASLSPLFGATRLSTAESAFNQHNLPGSLLCGSRAGSAGTQSLCDASSASGGNKHRSPRLHPPLSHGDGFHVRRRISPSRSFDTQPSQTHDGPMGASPIAGRSFSPSRSFDGQPSNSGSAGASLIATGKGSRDFDVTKRRTPREPPNLFRYQLAPSTIGHPTREAFGTDTAPAVFDRAPPSGERELARDSDNRDRDNNRKYAEESSPLRRLRARHTATKTAGTPQDKRHTATALTDSRQDKGSSCMLRPIDGTRRTRLEDSSNRRSTAAAAAADTALVTAYRGRRHRHRGSGTPRRKIASKKSVGRRRQSGAQADTVASGTRFRESVGGGGEDDLAARAMTAARAVLRC